MLPNIYNSAQLREFAEASDKPALTTEEMAARGLFGVGQFRTVARGTEIQRHNGIDRGACDNVRRLRSVCSEAKPIEAPETPGSTDWPAEAA